MELTWEGEPDILNMSLKEHMMTASDLAAAPMEVSPCAGTIRAASSLIEASEPKPHAPRPKPQSFSARRAWHQVALGGVAGRPEPGAHRVGAKWCKERQRPGKAE